MKKILLFPVLLLFAIGVIAPAFAATKNVSIKNIQYNPSTETIQKGDKVTWTNNDGSTPHSVTAVDGSFNSTKTGQVCSQADTSGCMKSGDTFSVTFNKTGTFAYYCNVHCPNNSCDASGMRGKVIVQGPTPTPVRSLPPRTPTPAPHHTTAPTTAPVARTTPKVSSRPSSSPSASPTATPVDTLGSFASPASSAIAFGSTSKGSGRGPLVGLAIGTVAVAIGAGLLFWFRTRGSAP